MAQRTDLPRIPVNQEPTIFNENMGKWAFWGSFLSGVVGGVVSSLTLNPIAGGVAGAASTAIFGLIGGQIGQAQIEKENREGKVVSDPTFWNKRILSNYMAASIGTALIALPLAGIALATGSSGVLIAAAATAVLGKLYSIYSGISGGFEGKSRMQEELNQAIEIKQSMEIEQAMARSQARGQGVSRSQEVSHDVAKSEALMKNPYVNSVTQEESALLSARQTQGAAGGRSFVQGVEQARAAAAQLQQQGPAPA